MDLTEQIVAKHLAHRGYKYVVYEPDGNIPPDFLLDGAIAVEVRLLNQNYSNNSKVKGLDEITIPLSDNLKKIAESFGAPLDGKSWLLFFRFSRTIESWKTLEPTLREALTTFSQSSNKQKGNIAKAKGFEMEVIQAHNPYTTLFVMGGFHDKDADGMLLYKMEQNIQYCVNEKSQKIERVRAKYSNWWLALVDSIGYSLNDFERELFRDKVSIQHNWDKIILIDPRDHTNYFEI